MANLADAIVQARRDAWMASRVVVSRDRDGDWKASPEREPWDAALARLERLVRLDQAQREQDDIRSIMGDSPEQRGALRQRRAAIASEIAEAVKSG